jgi:hypothetical protein
MKTYKIPEELLVVGSVLSRHICQMTSSVEDVEDEEKQ